MSPATRVGLTASPWTANAEAAHEPFNIRLVQPGGTTSRASSRLLGDRIPPTSRISFRPIFRD